MIIYLTILIVFIAFILNALAGFGAGVMAVPFLVLLYPLKIVSPLMNLLGFFANIILIKTFYKHLKYQLLLPLIMGNLLGAVAGSYFLVLASNTLLVKILGILTLVSSIIIFAFNGKLTFKPNLFLGLIIGLISGILSAVFAIGGVPIILYLSSILKEKTIFRSACLAFFLINGVMQTFLFAYHGLMTKQVLTLFIFSIPALIIAGWFGHKIHTKIAEATFRKLVFAVLIISGIMLIIK